MFWFRDKNNNFQIWSVEHAGFGKTNEKKLYNQIFLKLAKYTKPTIANIWL